MEEPSSQLPQQIELTPKKAGIALLLIFIVIAAGLFLIKGAGKSSEKNAADTIAHQAAAVNKPPVAAFKPIKPCYAYIPCLLDASGSYDPDGSIVSYKWLVDGIKDFDTFSYPVLFGIYLAGQHDAFLKVTDDKGLSSLGRGTFEVADRYDLKLPTTSNREEQISAIRSFCKSPLKVSNYSSYYNGYINDFHHHIPTDNPYNYTIALLAAMNEFGVKRTAISQIGAGVEGNRAAERENDKIVAEIAGLCPERFDPMLSAVYPDDPSSVEYVRKSLEVGPWKGLGEIYIKNKLRGGHYLHEISNLANTSTMMQIYKILAEKKKPIHFHLDVNTTEDMEAVKQAFSENPNTAFVWAHSCGAKGSLAYEYSNLFCEVEMFAHKPVAEEGVLGTKVVMGTDSSVFGTNTSRESQNYQFVVETMRLFLQRLVPEIATINAYANYEFLLGQ